MPQIIKPRVLGDFSAEDFVNKLKEEGTKIPCDDSISAFNKNILPDFYDEEKFERGQKFFQKHIFALYFSKLLGLIITLSTPSVLNVLKLTNMSGCVYFSYKRYIATLLHMNIWYEDNLSEGSRAWISLKKVKYMHNTASKLATKRNLPPISQTDMTLTQFGFMGLAVCRSKLVGIHNASNEEFDGFIHFWRVIGSILGIKDRYNICRESIEETRQICEALIDKILIPNFENKQTDFIEMTSYLVEGMWNMVPVLHHKVLLSFLYDITKYREYCAISNNKQKKINKEAYFILNQSEISRYNLFSFFLNAAQYNIVRW